MNAGFVGTPVVISPHVERMTEAYHVAATGRVYVMCAPANSGKTSAAELFVHGKYRFRPRRSLMVSAAEMTDFASEFASELGVSGVKFAEFIISALSGRAPKIHASAAGIALKAGDLIESVSWSHERYPFDEQKEIEILGGEILGEALHDLPALVIDNFNESSDESIRFVKSLFEQASRYGGVVVFILTRHVAWATKLVGLNGGSKTKPLFGNVENSDYEFHRPFVGTPKWNTLP